MGKYIPKTASARELQTQYRKLLNEVKETHEPIVIMSNNKQEAVIIDIDTYERLREVERKQEKLELMQRAKPIKDFYNNFFYLVWVMVIGWHTAEEKM